MMKNHFVLLMLAAFSAACSHAGDEPPANAVPVCSITAPDSGALLDLNADLVITGTGEDADGNIVKVTLTVAGRTVPDVTAVPFSHTVPAGELNEGELTITLSVEDDRGATASDEVTVTVQDNSQAPVCRIVSPADGAVVGLHEPLVVSGEGGTETGSIDEVTLTVGGTEVGEVDAVPFSYTVGPEMLSEGELEIILTVSNDAGKAARDKVTVTVKDLNESPVCKIVSPADGSEAEAGMPLVIAGTGSDDDGSIAGAVLVVNGTVVEDVSAVPFEYELPADMVREGEMTILLTVEDDLGKTASDRVTVNILGRDRTFTDPRDAKTYKTVKLGAQEWFAENLAYLPEVYPGDIGTNDEGYEDKPLYYVYGYFGTDVAEAKALDTYETAGVLYNWYAAVGGTVGSDPSAVPSGVQGPCPGGWHVPSRAEWVILNEWAYAQIPDEDGVMYSDAGGSPSGDSEMRLCKNVNGALKAKGVWEADYSEDELPQLVLGGLDLFGFGGVPSGARLHTGDYFYYYSNNQQLTFWTPDWNTYFPSNSGGGTIAFTSLYYDLRFSKGGSAAERGYSIRCVKD